MYNIKAMEKEEDFYRTLLDNLYDAVYAVDRERRITYWNRSAEQLTGFAADEVMGRHCRDNILVHVNGEGVNLCETACPLSRAMEEGVPGEVGIFLHHREGHRIPVTVRCSPIRDADGRVTGAIEVFRDDSPRLELEERMEELRQQALLDHLTGVGNRRYTEMELANRLEEMRRHGWPFGLAFMDIDNFKEANDRHGHDAGDRVLEMVARTTMNSLRPFDFLGRWGGEEFVAIVSHAGEENLRTTAERIRALVAKSALPLEGGQLRVTVSIGATLAKPSDTPESLVKRADELMYASKRAGRNQVTLG
jgi:diguanylate cyclase (GGDEF)-like protein/PAS domain S-box-containing protein